MTAEEENENKGGIQGAARDRRRHPRFRVNLHVRFRPANRDAVPYGAFSTALVLNISEGGMLMRVQSNLRVGQRLEVQMHREGKPTVQFGIVRIVRLAHRRRLIPGHDVGLAFEKP